MRCRLGMAVLCLIVWGAGAEEACDPCDSNSEFPGATEFLDSQGLDPAEYAVSLTWSETCRAGGEPRLVTGYHVLPADGSGAFDLYSDDRGNLLGLAELDALAVYPKNWDMHPAAQSEVSRKGRPEPKPVPASVMAGIVVSSIVELPPIDLDAVRLEDKTNEAVLGKGVTRIGVFQDLGDPLEAAAKSASVGEWEALPGGGSLWTVAIHSPDAKGQRIHFAELRLPPKGQVIVYNAHDPDETYGPFHGPPPGEGALWSPTCFSDLAIVECCLASEADGKDVSVIIDRVSHIYKGLDMVPWGAASPGACNLDVTCYPEWATTALGVGGLGTIGAEGVLWCTGSLLVDTDPDTEVPYFLTANHCVRGQSGVRGASDLEVYWLYQTDTCDGVPPSPVDVPRTTGGADYLAGSTGTGYTGGGNDFTFLRLRQSPPPGLAYLGWATEGPTVGTEVTCIHHPRGDFKRISFGTLTDIDNTYDSLYHEVVWHDGTTEGGSSGSPMLLFDTQQIVGQLWGGTASCGLPGEPDYYGRFDVTFPVVQSYLDPPGDVLEVDFSASEYNVDEADGTVTITVELTGSPGAEVTVDYATADGTAEAGEDYEAASGTLAFEGTGTLASFEITLHPDTTPEGDETVAIALANPNGCTLAGANDPAVLNIIDDDPDADGDGLSDYDETNGTYGYVTDPNLADTDGDGYSDYEEVMGTFGMVTDPTQPTELCSLSVPFFEASPPAT